MAAPLRLAFMGSPDFAVLTLSALLEAGHNVACVYTQPPRSAGRGHRVRKCAVHRKADEHELPSRTLERFDELATADFAALSLDVAVVVAYGLLLPPAALSAPRLGCVNMHASLLPRWRGAAPIQRAIMAGDILTGVTAMQMDGGVDTGPMLATRTFPITAATTFGSLHDQMAEVASTLAVETLAGLEAATLRPIPQPETGATYAARIGKEDAHIDWTQSAVAVERQIRALCPSPGAWFSFGGERIKLLAAEVREHGAGRPGKVLDDRLTVACGSGAIRALRLQRPGRRALPADAFLRGLAIPAGVGLAA